MKISVSAFDVSRQDSDVTLEIEAPRKCPRCGVSYNPNAVNAVYVDRESMRAYITFFCSYCEECFMMCVECVPASTGYVSYRAYTKWVSPINADKPEWDDAIKKLSPEFCSIYEQAHAAEYHQLNLISGMGYRRALEFLVKDYAIHFYPDQKDDIILENLAKCIKNYIAYPKLQTVAEKAAWLGNDHSHYQSKHPDMDVNDLKKLINITVHWVSMELGTEDAEKISHA